MKILPSKPILEKQLRRRLQEILAEAGWQLPDESFANNSAPANRPFDLMVEIPSVKGEEREEIELWVDWVPHPRPSRMPHVNVERDFKDKKIRCKVMGMPYAGPRMIEACEKHGWAWFDLAGNCRISIPRTMYIERLGSPPVYSPREQNLKLSTVQASKLVRALLVPEHAGRDWNQTELREEASVSAGLVHKVVHQLQEADFLEETKTKRFRLWDPKGLLMKWSEVYRPDSQARSECFTLLKPKEIHERLAKLELEQPMIPRFSYASFSAADFQAPVVRQSRIWIFAVAGEEGNLLERLEAHPVDSGGNLELLTPEDKGVFYKGDYGESRLRATNPLQTYIDLYHSGGRGEEAAEAIMNQALKPKWEQAGFRW
ncbi:MAG: type IV toxin-antitoxin system AbiEi family antitoxin [Verrucomicrobiota bacterium]